MKIRNVVLALGTFIATGGSALAVTSFTETFNTNASNWLNAASPTPTAATYNATGGIGNSGYISYLAPDFTLDSGGFGDPLKLMFRGNAADDASGGAFVGDWISGGIETFSLAVRHNYSTSLNLYTRITPGGGVGASLASIYSVAPNTWTTITIPITDSNPPFASYGGPGANFNGVFSNVQNLQIGFYMPADIEITGFRMDLDNVAIAVPEPHEYALGMAGLLAIVVLARRRRLSAQV